jgi:DNA-directed RNA polymerase I, II, and III subunit RPABC1
MDKLAAKRGIIIYSEKMSSVAKKVRSLNQPPQPSRVTGDGALKSQSQTLQEMQSEYTLEDFSESDLLVNITRHFLVPKHEIMKPADKAELIKK